MLKKIKYYIYVFIRRIPKARKYGVRYFFDSRYRKTIKYRVRNRRYRQTRGASFMLKKNKIRKRLAKDKGQFCSYCYKYLPLSELTIDHIIRIRDGGSSNYKNLQLLCISCHIKKDRLIKSNI